jgi:hypothetical protein
MRSGAFAEACIAQANARRAVATPEELAQEKARAERMLRHFESIGDKKFAAFWRERLQLDYN